MILLLLALAAHAQPEIPEFPPPIEVPSPESLPEVWADMDPQQLLTDAVRRRDLGDFAAADARFAVLRERGATAPVLYHAALSLEFQERYAEALSDYETVIARWPDTIEATDSRFRRALCLEDLGRHAESLAQIKALEAEGQWDDHDRLTLELERGVNELRTGKARQGIRRIDAALAELGQSGDLPWMQAKARVALARFLLDEAREIKLTGDKKAARRLETRARLMSQAERQVIEATKLAEPEYVLDGLLLLGDAYVALHDDLLAAPPPRKLDAEQRAIYLDVVTERAATLEKKAWAYYDEGVALAVRTHWQGEVARKLVERREALAR